MRRRHRIPVWYAWVALSALVLGWWLLGALHLG